MDTKDEVVAWASRPVTSVTAADGNALTVDVEDYFQVEAFSDLIDRESWERHECRIERNVDRILAMFADAGARATFFTLGWVAQRYPEVVRRIVAGGHELASHGLAHHRADRQSHGEFFDDVRHAKHLLEDTGGVAVNGYRAASFSIGRQNLWALESLNRAGYRYSSSVYPIRHDRYGIPDAPRFAFYPAAGCDFIEIPVTSVRRFGMNWPCGGGGFFRLAPYWVSANNMRAVARRDKQPCVFYFHPWEIDAGQPRIKQAPFKTRFRHYMNIGRMQRRLEQLLKDFAWTRIDEIYPVSDT